MKINVSLACESLQYVRGLGMWAGAVAFGRPFESSRGRLLRVTVEGWRHWNKAGESGIGRNVDNLGGHWLTGFHVARLFEFRHYRLIATHVSVGPVTLSWVRGTWLPTSGPRLYLGERPR